MKQPVDKNKFYTFDDISVNISSPKYFTELLIDDNFNKHIVSEKNAKKINFDITINVDSQTKKNITICIVCYENTIFQGFLFEKQSIFYDKYNKKGSHYLSKMPTPQLYSLHALLLRKMFVGNNLTDNEKKACAISLMHTYSILKRCNYIKYRGISKNMEEYFNNFFSTLVDILNNIDEYKKLSNIDEYKNIQQCNSKSYTHLLEDFNKKFNNFCSQNTQNLYNGKLHNNGLKLRNVDNNITNIDNNIIFEPKNIVNNNSLQTKITFHQQNQQSEVMKEDNANNKKTKKQAEQEKSYKQEDEEEIIANDKYINLNNQETITALQGQNETISGSQTKQGKQQKECYLFEYLNICNCCKICQNKEELQKK